MILANHAEHVEKEHVAAKVKMASLSDALKGNDKTPSQILKSTISFRALVESDGQRLKKRGKQWSCSCPFHPDRTPSFFIYESDDYAKCHGCGWHGDIFAYVMKRVGCGFCDAMTILSTAGSLHGTKTITSPSFKAHQDGEYKFTETDLKEIARYTARLQEVWIYERIAASRNWKPETIRSLAQSGHLGWAGDALAFIYKTGVKLRNWPDKVCFWSPGSPHIWRADVLPSATTVYITEGEPDSITLIDLGVERQEGVAVVAAPSASTFHDKWCPLFAGKDVIICFDADEAGRKGIERVGPQLAASARSVSEYTFGKEAR